MRKIWIGSLLVVLILVAGCAGSPKPESATPPAATGTPAPEVKEEKREAPVAGENPYKGKAEAIAKGKTIFKANCEACHAANGKGVGMPNIPDFTNAAWWSSQQDSKLFNSISNGVTGTAMPAWKDTLSEEEIWKVLAYERSFAG